MPAALRKDGSAWPPPEATIAFSLHLILGDGVGEEDGVGGVGDQHQHVRPGPADLLDHRAEVGGGGGVRFVEHDLVTGLLGQLLPLGGKALAPVAVLIDEGELLDLGAELVLHVLEEGELVPGPPGVLGGDAEDVLEALLGDLVGDRDRDDEGDAVAFGHRGGRVGDGAVPAAGQDMDLLGVDQPFGLGHALLRFRLGVGVDQFQLHPAQRLDAAGGVDLLDRHLAGRLALLAKGRGGAGHRFDVADFDGVGLGQAERAQRQGKGDGGEGESAQ